MSVHASGWPDIPGYTIEALLGEGGFALVFRAVQLGVGRPVALKVLNRGPDDADAAKHFAKEVRAIGLVSDHDHVVTVYDAGTTESGRAFIAMQLLPEGSFHDLLRTEGPLPAGEVARVGREIASALGAAHDAGIIHRDLKPQNVLVGRGRRALLSDFGIASLADATRTATGQLPHGTLAYIAPEALQGERRTPASDVFSLGATLYTLASGRAAFVEPDDAPATVMKRLLLDEPPPLLGVPGWLATVIERCLRKDPAERPGTDDVVERLASPVGRASPHPAIPPAAPSVTVPGLAPDPLGTPRPSAPPSPSAEVRFGVDRARTPQELAEVVARRWDEAVDRLESVAFRVDLVAAIESAFGPGTAGSLGGDWQAGRRFGPHRRVAELIVTLDPSRPPIFPPLVASDEDLARAAASARSGQVFLRRAIDRLYEEQALVTLARHEGRGSLLRLHHMWLHEMSDYEGQVPPSKQTAFARATVLQVLCSAEARVALANRIQRPAGADILGLGAGSLLAILDAAADTARPGAARPPAGAAPRRSSRWWRP